MVTILDAILPISTLIVTALLTIPIFKLIRKSNYKTGLTLAWILVVFILAGLTVANLAFSYYSIPNPEPLNLTLDATSNPAIASSFLIDAISIYMVIIMTAIACVVMIYAVLFVKSADRPSDRYFAVMILLTGALIGAVLAGDLLTFFIFWEATTVAAAFLMLYRKSTFSLSATLKYLIMIIIASAFVVLGLSIVYSLTGTLNYIALRDAISSIAGADMNLLIISFIFIAAGYAIEAAIVPFHFWLPDAYTAAPAPSAAFLSSLVDQGSYYIIIRILLFIILPPSVGGAFNWTLMIAIMAALTMIVGNLLALIQNNVKRLIAYICVADVGYNLIAITSTTQLGLTGNLYFFLIGGLTTALAFMAIGIINSHGFRTLDDFAGVGKKMPWSSLALVIAGLSFAGIPPLGGFIAKYFVFTAAISADLTWLAIIGVLTSVIQTAYIFRLVNVMYGKTPKDGNTTVIKENQYLLIPVFILVAAIFIIGLFPDTVLQLFQPIMSQLPWAAPIIP
ncbi:MAG: NADH-quinone oxidoreductase subunit N [Nitrososphaerota archaeon]|jgi:proton-translocating NADH-quinone oxidoreductase chain N|nr:NADH-quinone oxidoreductase subunit N [Nitrososphaerota archaeon]